MMVLFWPITPQEKKEAEGHPWQHNVDVTGSMVLLWFFELIKCQGEYDDLRNYFFYKVII